MSPLQIHQLPPQRRPTRSDRQRGVNGREARKEPSTARLCMAVADDIFENLQQRATQGRLDGHGGHGLREGQGCYGGGVHPG